MRRAYAVSVSHRAQIVHQEKCMHAHTMRVGTFVAAHAYTQRILFSGASVSIASHSRRVHARRMRPRARLAVLGGLIAATTTIAARRPTSWFEPGVSFRVSASTRLYPGDTPRGQDDEVMRGRGIAADNHSRIEFLAFTPTPPGVTTDDYVIGLDSGKAFIQHTANGTYTPANDEFGGPAPVAMARILGGGRGGFGRGGSGPPAGGRGGRGGGGARGARGVRGGRIRGGMGADLLGQLSVLDVKFNLEKLGAGDPIDGRPTQHYRITTDYRITWSDQSFPAHAVTEVWTTPLPTAIPNPFEPLIVADQSTDGPLVEYALKLRAVRAQLEGTPIKVVTTTTLSDVRDIVGFQSLLGPESTDSTIHIVQQTQITGIQPADVDPKLLVVPDSSGAD